MRKRCLALLPMMCSSITFNGFDKLMQAHSFFINYNSEKPNFQGACLYIFTHIELSNKDDVEKWCNHAIVRAVLADRLTFPHRSMAIVATNFDDNHLIEEKNFFLFDFCHFATQTAYKSSAIIDYGVNSISKLLYKYLDTDTIEFNFDNPIQGVAYRLDPDMYFSNSYKSLLRPLKLFSPPQVKQMHQCLARGKEFFEKKFLEPKEINSSGFLDSRIKEEEFFGSHDIFDILTRVGLRELRLPKPQGPYSVNDALSDLPFVANHHRVLFYTGSFDYFPISPSSLPKEVIQRWEEHYNKILRLHQCNFFYLLLSPVEIAGCWFANRSLSRRHVPIGLPTAESFYGNPNNASFDDQSEAVYEDFVGQFNFGIAEHLLDFDYSPVEFAHFNPQAPQKTMLDHYLLINHFASLFLAEMAYDNSSFSQHIDILLPYFKGEVNIAMHENLWMMLFRGVDESTVKRFTHLVEDSFAQYRQRRKVGKMTDVQLKITKDNLIMLMTDVLGSLVHFTNALIEGEGDNNDIISQNTTLLQKKGFLDISIRNSTTEAILNEWLRIGMERQAGQSRIMIPSIVQTQMKNIISKILGMVSLLRGIRNNEPTRWKIPTAAEAHSVIRKMDYRDKLRPAEWVMSYILSMNYLVYLNNFTVESDIFDLLRIKDEYIGLPKTRPNVTGLTKERMIAFFKSVDKCKKCYWPVPTDVKEMIWVNKQEDLLLPKESDVSEISSSWVEKLVPVRKDKEMLGLGKEGNKESGENDSSDHDVAPEQIEVNVPSFMSEGERVRE